LNVALVLQAVVEINSATVSISSNASGKIHNAARGTWCGVSYDLFFADDSGGFRREGNDRSHSENEKGNQEELGG